MLIQFLGTVLPVEGDTRPTAWWMITDAVFDDFAPGTCLLCSASLTFAIVALCPWPANNDADLFAFLIPANSAVDPLVPS